MIWRLRIITVNGPSMAPTLHHGDRVLVWLTPSGLPRRGDIAVVALPQGLILKRIAALPGDLAPPGVPGPRVPAGMLALLGDNPQYSVDSRDFGFVPVRSVYGVVLRRLSSGSMVSSSKPV